MSATQLAALRFFALLCLLPGIAGLIVAAMISSHYADTLPRQPDPAQMRIIPRGIEGMVVYQTPAENRRLNWMEYGSIGIFSAGLVLGLVYLEKWGSAQARAAEDENVLAGHSA